MRLPIGQTRRLLTQNHPERSVERGFDGLLDELEACAREIGTFGDPGIVQRHWPEFILQYGTLKDEKEDKDLYLLCIIFLVESKIYYWGTFVPSDDGWPSEIYWTVNEAPPSIYKSLSAQVYSE